ncbi:MAG: hypothetical protein FD175_754 [Beijerinckiaceae bacterium]|nr:MAG: hypothetical protein FD175_754 [Beijerinckiaceae bacterium]
MPAFSRCCPGALSLVLVSSLAVPALGAAAKVVDKAADKAVHKPVGKPPNPFCASVPRLNWLSAEEVEMRLREQGLSLVRLRLADDKCYAVLVRDASGQTRDLILHPVTAEIVR